jgi:hypothetical protein
MKLIKTGVTYAVSCRNVKHIKKEARCVKEETCVEVFLRDNTVHFLG